MSSRDNSSTATDMRFALKPIARLTKLSVLADELSPISSSLMLVARPPDAEWRKFVGVRALHQLDCAGGVSRSSQLISSQRGAHAAERDEGGAYVESQ
jgi:hypothetical protein